LDQSRLLHQQETIVETQDRQLKLRFCKNYLSNSNCILVINGFDYGAVFRIGESLWATEEGFFGQCYFTVLVGFIAVIYEGFSGRLYLCD
jgi:hypothetical protein